MQPSSAEAQAAYYNIGCCHVRLQQWQEAVDAIKTSINEYGVPYKTAQEVHAPTARLRSLMPT